MLYEFVNDYALRERLNQTWGFCREHAFQLQSMGDPLGHAIIYSGLLDHLIKEFSHTPNHFTHRSNRRSNKFHRPECPVCTKAWETEERYIAGLLECLQEEDFRSKFKQSPGLCIPHFMKCMARCANHNIALIIRDTQLAAMQDLSAQLKEIIRKSDYRFVDEPVGKEKDAWIRAVHLLVGYKPKK